MWAIGFVMPNQERRVADKIQKAFDCVAYFPRARTQLNRVRAAFPGYLFVDRFIPELTRMREALNLDGFRHWLLSGDKPSTVSCEAIELVRKAELAGEFDHKDAKLLSGGVKPGSVVRIATGSFSGFVGVVRRCSHGSVQIDVSGRVITCPLSFLRAA